MRTEHEANWSVVTGDRFRERRDRLNLTQDQLAEEAGVSRDTVRHVEQDRAGKTSRRRVGEALTRLEFEARGEAAAGATGATVAGERPEPHLIEFEVTGDFGVRVVVKGPVDNAAELEASVARLIRDMKSDRD
jgi:DNA-binding XRE family transcriptional regulator